MDEIKFWYYELKNGIEINKRDDNFIMFNPITEMFLLFRIQDNVNIFLYSFGYEDIKFNY